MTSPDDIITLGIQTFLSPAPLGVKGRNGWNSGYQRLTRLAFLQSVLPLMEPRSRPKQTETVFYLTFVHRMKLYSLSTSKLINIASREKKKHPSGSHRRVLFQLLKLQTIVIWLVLQSFPTKWTSNAMYIFYKIFLASENKAGSSVSWGYDNDLSIDQKRSGDRSLLWFTEYRIQGHFWSYTN